jgi:hypothetical protein
LALRLGGTLRLGVKVFLFPSAIQRQQWRRFRSDQLGAWDLRKARFHAKDAKYRKKRKEDKGGWTYLRLADKRRGLLINFKVAAIKDGIVRIVNGLED